MAPAPPPNQPITPASSSILILGAGVFGCEPSPSPTLTPPQKGPLTSPSINAPSPPPQPPLRLHTHNTIRPLPPLPLLALHPPTINIHPPKSLTAGPRTYAEPPRRQHRHLPHRARGLRQPDLRPISSVSAGAMAGRLWEPACSQR